VGAPAVYTRARARFGLIAMTVWGLLRRVGPMDLRAILRDRLLVWFLVLPLLVAALLGWGMPLLSGWLQAGFGFDLIPYYPLIAGSYILVAPSMVGFVVGFLLLDERDDHVLDAWRVTPVSLNDLFLYRVGAPVLIGTGMTLVGYSFMQLAPIPIGALMSAAALGAGTAPTVALVLVGFADNKVSAFAIAKLASAVSNLALVAWFIPMPWQLLAGGLPSYWPMKVVWQSAIGAAWEPYAAAGLVVNVLAITVLRVRYGAAFDR
jgi:fluoroquinolone transport system permease protein